MGGCRARPADKARPWPRRLVYEQTLVSPPSAATSQLPAPQTATGREVRLTLAESDRLHRLPSQTRPVVVAEDATLASVRAIGGYNWRTRTIGIHPSGPHVLLTMAHEFGHYVDYELAPQAGRITKSGDPAIREWSRAVHASDAVQALKALQSAFPYGTTPARRLRYYLREREIWARSYAQWVAARSGQADMIQAVNRILTEGNAIYRQTQWSAGDFAAIASAIDRLFASRGLTR